jgi:hypothetical protein
MGDVAVTQTGIAHAAQASAPAQVIEFSPVRFDPSDTYGFHLGAHLRFFRMGICSNALRMIEN